VQLHTGAGTNKKFHLPEIVRNRPTQLGPRSHPTLNRQAYGEARRIEERVGGNRPRQIQGGVSQIMRKLLVLGAGGKIARWVIAMLANSDEVNLALYLRDASKLKGSAPKNSAVLQGDVLSEEQLDRAIGGQDIVYANLAGFDIDAQAANIVKAMNAVEVKRLIFVTSLGIYDEVPGKFGAWNRREIAAYLPPFRRAADIIEASGTDYAILRPAWLTNKDEVDYETTARKEPFKGTEVSRKSVAALIVKIIDSPGLYSRSNLGVNKPGTDGDKPAFL
jgi:uncharacterized protein YbjT (DUF2867 family)